VFRFGSGKNATLGDLNKFLKSPQGIRGFKNKIFSGRSLREGVPLDMEKRPEPTGDI